MSDSAWLAKLEFKRLQTYLFAAPQLKSMIGANALVGETLRGRLSNGQFISDSGRDNLPRLAVKCGARLPSGVQESLQSLPPGPAPRDPLTTDRDQDDPEAAYSHGILSRDGGHLHAVFPSRIEAEQFIREARQLVGRLLPQLILAARLVPLTREESKWKAGRAESHPVEPAEEFADLPQFQVCEITGQGPASHREHRDDREVRFSASVRARENKAVQFDAGDSADVLGLLRQPLLETFELPRELQREAFPNDFENVAPSGYLAVIVADGNRVGTRSTEWRKEKAPDQKVLEEVDFFEHEAWGEQFYHSMRVAVRRSLIHALKVTFGCAAERVREGTIPCLPFRLMMLGGDDLLLVCDARYAMRFAIHYAEELDKHPLVDNSPLHVGMGVAIVKRKFPFHRAHALAEQLKDSAKKRSRTESVIDWLAVSEAWHEDVAEVRRRDAVRSYPTGPGDSARETLVLSRKPYRILGAEDSLEALRAGAWEAASRLPRGQLMGLAEIVARGRRQADWAVHALGQPRLALLTPVLHGSGDDATIWCEHPGQVFSTSLLDFLELFELERPSSGTRQIESMAEEE